MKIARMHSWRGIIVGCALAGLPATGQTQITVTPSAVPYRGRLLGVYAATSGTAVDGARVTDMVNHVTAMTTATGTVSLAFLPEGANLVRIEKIGFQPTTIGVRISSDDTVPITVLLQALAHDLPAVVTRDSNPR
jgi:hypothetical protein